MDTLSPFEHQPALRTVEEARQALSSAGVSLSAWARAHGFKPSTVAAVLRGERQARIGQGHKVAVALRIKHGVIADDPKDV
jgi:gp16 family phage-associated protein